MVTHFVKTHIKKLFVTHCQFESEDIEIAIKHNKKCKIKTHTIDLRCEETLDWLDFPFLN